MCFFPTRVRSFSDSDREGLVVESGMRSYKVIIRVRSQNGVLKFCCSLFFLINLKSQSINTITHASSTAATNQGVTVSSPLAATTATQVLLSFKQRKTLDHVSSTQLCWENDTHDDFHYYFMLPSLNTRTQTLFRHKLRAAFICWTTYPSRYKTTQFFLPFLSSVCTSAANTEIFLLAPRTAFTHTRAHVHKHTHGKL